MYIFYQQVPISKRRIERAGAGERADDRWRSVERACTGERAVDRSLRRTGER